MCRHRRNSSCLCVYALSVRLGSTLVSQHYEGGALLPITCDKPNYVHCTQHDFTAQTYIDRMDVLDLGHDSGLEASDVPQDLLIYCIM